MADLHPLLSVVVVNYNTRQFTLDCLASLYESARRSGLTIEVIVIDNASSDGSPSAIRAAYPSAQIVANTANHYFSAAYTQGVAQAQGEYVIVLNSDMVVRGETLGQLVRALNADSTIGAATTNLYTPDGRLQRTGARFTPYPYLVLQYTFLGKILAARLRRLNDWLWYADWDRTTARDIDVLPGSCIIARRAVWQQTGGFDARMLMYFSDDYLSRAVQGLGKRTVYLQSDGIVHYEGGSSRQISAWVLRTYLRDLLVYTRLVYGRAAQLTLAILLVPTWVMQRLRVRRA